MVVKNRASFWPRFFTNFLKSERGQISMQMIVFVIIALVVLTLILVFVTGKFRVSSQAISQLSPGDRDIAISTCQFACDQANLATGSPEECEKWQNRYCTKEVTVGAMSFLCKDNELGFTCTSPYGCSCPLPTPPDTP